MDLNINIEGNNIILKLAQIILTDWSYNIKKQCSSHKPKFPFKKYKVLLIQDDTKISTKLKQPNLNVDIIIIIQGTKIHPIHILALSQQLSFFGQNSKQLFIPLYLAQITIANCISITVLQYVFFNLSKSKTKIKNVNVHRLHCIECVKYFGAFNISLKANDMCGNKKGFNMLDGGAPFYSIYKTKEGFVAIGNLQSKFYEQMLKEMKLSPQEMKFCLQNQLDFSSWDEIRQILAKKLMQKTAKEWQQAMKNRDTCVTYIREYHPNNTRFIHPILIKPKI